MPTTVTLPLLPLPDGVAFPDMVLTVALETDEARAAAEAAVDDQILLVPRLGDRFARVGTIGRIETRGRLPGGIPALTVRVGPRATLGAGAPGTTRELRIEAEPVESEPTSRSAELARRYRAVAGTLLDEVGGRRLASALSGVTDPSALADTIGYWPDLSLERRVELLETIDVDARLELAIEWATEALNELELRNQIREEVQGGLEKEQRDAILRRQLAAIRKELGQDADGDEGSPDGYRARLEALADAITGKARTAIDREIDRLERSGDQGTESSWIRTWLDTVFEVPWGEVSSTEPALAEGRAILDADHTGLGDVKDRLVEYLAIRQRRREKGSSESEPQDPPSRRGGVILALVGPPGVGKTSLGESVARALGRSFVRLSLGGIRDEAEIRGHRRTYVGARPGRLVRALVEAETMNPVVLLDEIDKVGADWRGDPSSALLEVLDPAQNHTFRDHYLEFELDLSDVVFIATANTLDTIPGPLLDRLEIIPVDGYHLAEKSDIARDHLVPRLADRLGLEDGEVMLSPEVIESVISNWTAEAGVRGLERALERVLRKSVARLATGERTAPVVIELAELEDLLGRPLDREDALARSDLPGVATGLAVTGAGGDVLFVEANVADGEPGLTLTGQLGDVMKESGEIALSFLRAHADELEITSPMNRRFHVHFPAGAVPKDGPSAGITMTTALASLLTGRSVRRDLAMTGEISLAGRVLPIGGVKQKLLAAHRAGLARVILPRRNERDLKDVPEAVRDDLDIHLVDDVRDVLELALI